MTDLTRAERLRQISRRFRDTPCCGRGGPLVTDDDLRYLGLFPPPMVFASSWGHVAPNAGWFSRCLWVYETLARAPAPGRPEDKRDLPGAVADLLDRLAGQAECG